MRFRICLMFTAFLLGGSQPTQVRREGRTTRGGQRNQHLEFDAQLDVGTRAFAFLEDVAGNDAARAYKADRLVVHETGSQPTVRLPHGFWKKFIKERLHLRPTKLKQMQLSRAMHVFLVNSQGSNTRVALRGGRRRGSRRSSGAAANATKAPGIGFMLLQFFVDEVQKLCCRADSALLMNHARELRERLLEDGWHRSLLPILTGSAGKSWFRRWRISHGIVMNSIGMKLKVSWKKVLRRVGVLMRNIWRLRAFWELCHPGIEMRWLSLDQKPSWVNNAGLTKAYTRKGSQAKVRENYSATRQRYTILTSVPSWRLTANPDDPPKMAVLFKGKKNGTIKAKILNDFQPPEWMMIQVQENGSYRSEDVCEFLEWALPQATSPEESIIVILDWYSGHRTDEVEQLLERKGHVLLFHGGGTTPFTQINDTHLHATVYRLMISIENLWAHSQQKAARAAGHKITPCPKKHDTCRLVESMWLSIDHAGIAAKGYKQLGPRMAFDGPVAREDVFHDLLSVLERIDPPDVLGGVGVALREEAKAFVRQGYDAGKWRNWSDVRLLIEEHDHEDDPDVEGMEAFGVAVSDQSSDENGGDDAGEDGDIWEDVDGHDTAAPSQPVQDADVPMVVALDSDDDEAAPPIATASSVVVGPTDDDVQRAREVLIEHCRRMGDDVFLGRLYRDSAKSSRAKKDGATSSAINLRKRALEMEEAENKRLKAKRDADRLAANELEERRERTARAQEATEKQRTEKLRQVVINRRDQDARNKMAADQKAFQKWLQTTYPVELALRLMDLHTKMKPHHLKRLEGYMQEALSQRIFERRVSVPELWEPDWALTVQWVQTKQPSGEGHMFWVRCCPEFQGTVMQRCYPEAFALSKDMRAKRPDALAASRPAADTLMKLFQACLPCAEKALRQNAAYSPLRILHMNDYVMEKAFVWGVIAFSKWLTKEKWPQGIHEWPPPRPESAVPRMTSEAVTVEDNVPPHRRPGLPSASSGGS